MLLSKVSTRIKTFEKTFEEAKDVLIKGSLLCLGARTGCEIKAAKNKGYEAEGIDLYPLDPIVIKADWHYIPFKDETFDNVYTNSVDHCFDVEKLAKEIHRVLKSNGLFFFQVSKKQNLEAKDDKQIYMEQSANFLFWENGRALADCFCKYGFYIKTEWDNRKWENVILRKE
jgi:SAM-dependent methyltransferase